VTKGNHQEIRLSIELHDIKEWDCSKGLKQEKYADLEHEIAMYT